MKRHRLHNDGGFALIEAIATLALASLVMLTLILASDLVTRSAAAASRRAAALEMLGTGLSALREDLAAVKMISVSGGEGEERKLLFTGKSGSIRLIAGRDRSDLGDSDAVIAIDTQSDDGRSSLLRRSASLRPQTVSFDDVSFGSPVVYFVGPWTYKFSYAKQGKTLSWSESWSTANELPAAIRLEVFDKEGMKPVLPPLVVALHVDANVCRESNAEGCTDAEQAQPADQQPTDGTQDVQPQ